MHFTRTGIAFLLTIALAGHALALDPHKLISQFTHTSWSASDGLPGPVRAIAQTPNGYLWLGTEAGLYRFDGIRFTAWEPVFGERVPGSAVLSLCTARDGSLWIGYGSGGIAHLQDNRLRGYLAGGGVPSGGILSIVEDKNGVIWVAGAYGFGRFKNGKWEKVGAESGYPAPGAQSLLVDRRGTLWVATDGLDFGLGKDTVRRNTILTLAPDSNHFATTGEVVGMVRTIAEAPDGAIWIADTTGRTVRPITGEPLKKKITLNGESMCLLFDEGASIWVGLIEKGVRRLADYREARKSALQRFLPREGLSGAMVYSAFKDREGNVWFGTAGGLDRFRENKVTSLSAQEGLTPDQQIALSSTRDGSVWVMNYTRDSIHRIHGGQISHTHLPRYSSTDSNRILSLYAEAQNTVWVGGSFRLAHIVGGVAFHEHAKGLQDRASVEGIAKDSEGNLWVTLWSKESETHVLRLRGGVWKEFRRTEGLPKFHCRVIFADQQGRVWFGFENGEVAVFENGTFKVFSRKDGLQSGRVFTITSTRPGRILVGGEDGLSEFENGRFVTLTKRNGLPGNSVSGAPRSRLPKSIQIG
jgi:ligand-binding sensor domain-containing protein